MFSQNNLPSRAKIKVIGVGGAGCNAVNRIIASRLSGVEFIGINTDAQALSTCEAEKKVLIGESLTQGLGCGGDSELGRSAAESANREIEQAVEDADMVFITAGLGGGTGSGAASFVADKAKKVGALTVAIVTKPFLFEGPRRRVVAEKAAEELKGCVDTLITVPNDKLLQSVSRHATLKEAFNAADDVLRLGVQGISEVIITPGLINVDFADVRAILTNAGVALMGIGTGEGDQRAKTAAETAANSSFLETNIEGAKRLLVNITTGNDFTLGEAYDAMEYLLQYTDPDDSDIIFGHAVREELGAKVQITVLAAGMSPRCVSAPEPVSSESAQEEFLAPNLDIPTFLRRQREQAELKGEI
ncbi:MAG TPA: cell division protein FtsZ [Fimbriimonadales bacterium]|nr:cell division protein FtsZ [Fimbriimonadales bacterium]